jgi:hypothetical protein
MNIRHRIAELALLGQNLRVLQYSCDRAAGTNSHFRWSQNYQRIARTVAEKSERNEPSSSRVEFGRTYVYK